jgi:hypothetical protein
MPDLADKRRFAQSRSQRCVKQDPLGEAESFECKTVTLGISGPDCPGMELV